MPGFEAVFAIAGLLALMVAIMTLIVVACITTSRRATRIQGILGILVVMVTLGGRPLTIGLGPGPPERKMHGMTRLDGRGDKIKDMTVHATTLSNKRHEPPWVT